MELIVVRILDKGKRVLKYWEAAFQGYDWKWLYFTLFQTIFHWPEMTHKIPNLILREAEEVRVEETLSPPQLVIFLVLGLQSFSLSND